MTAKKTKPKGRVYQVDFNGGGVDVEHFQKPDKDRTEYVNIIDEVSDRHKLELEDLERLRLFDEAVEKVCTNRADSIIKPWFTLEPLANEELPESLLKAFDDWSNRTYRDSRNTARRYNIKQRLASGLDSTNWSGNGFVYKNYDDVEEATIQTGIKQEVNPTAKLLGYQVLPRRRVVFNDTHAEGFFYDFTNVSSSSLTTDNRSSTLNIHPSRIIDLILKDRPEGSWRGQALIESAIILLIAKMQTSNDMSFMMARILPKQVVKLLSSAKADKEFIQANLSGLVNRKAITTPKGIEFSVEGFKGKLIDLDKMYDIFYQALAIAADMPLDILKGVSAGQVTGSEVNTSQYFESIHSDQVRIEPILVDEFIDFARRNHNIRAGEIRFRVVWGSVQAPNKKEDAEQRLNHSAADRNYIEAGLSLDAINKDRAHFGLHPLEGELEQAPEGAEQTAGSIETTSPFMDTYQIEEDGEKALREVFNEIADDLEEILLEKEQFSLSLRGIMKRIRGDSYRIPSKPEYTEIVDSQTDKLIEISEDLHKESILTGNKKAFSSLGVTFNRDFLDEEELAWINDRSTKMIKGVTETMKDDIGRVLTRVTVEGKGPGAAVKDIRKIVGSTHRAQTIARTESLMASSFARHKSHKSLGVRFKVWFTAGDELVRDTHMIDGETVEIDELFSNGLLHPGDPNAPPEELVNCRCAEAPEVRRGG